MKSLILWSTQRKLFSSFLLFAYYLAVVLPHKRFGTFLNTVIFKGITRDQYNIYVAAISGIFLIFLSSIFYQNLKKSNNKKLGIYFILTVVLAILTVKYLFVINIEVVHFPQYALFAIMLFPIVKKYQSALIWSTLAGSLDEAYQYFYLSPNDTGYYDFNDVVTNLIGAAFGIIFMKSFNIEESETKSSQVPSEYLGLLLLSAVICFLFLTNILSYLPEEDIPFSILKGKINGFWSTIHPNVTYHVIRPLEGIFITIFLWVFYSKMSA